MVFQLWLKTSTHLAVLQLYAPNDQSKYIALLSDSEAAIKITAVSNKLAGRGGGRKDPKHGRIWGKTGPIL